MNPMLSLMLMLAAVMGAAVSIGIALFFFQNYQNPEPSPIQKRLTQLKEQQNQEGVFLNEQAQRLAKLYKEGDYQNEDWGKRLENLNLFLSLKHYMHQADMKTPPDQFFMTNMLLPVILFAVLGLMTGFFVLMLAGPVVAFGSYMFVLFKRGQRIQKLITQLPDALSLITSSLRAGHSFQASLTTVATELPEPIATEFSGLVRDINLGVPVKDAMARMVIRLDHLPDMCIFSTAVLIQREAGGNLAEVLEKLGYTIRERFKLKGQIAALTGQSRLTGYVLGGAPALILTGLSICMYSYVKPLWETDMGHLALLVVVVLQAIGFFVMQKIIDIRV